MHELVWITISKRKHTLQRHGQLVGWVRKQSLVDPKSWSCHVVAINSGQEYRIRQNEALDLETAKEAVLSMALHEIDCEGIR